MYVEKFCLWWEQRNNVNVYRHRNNIPNCCQGVWAVKTTYVPLDVVEQHKINTFCWIFPEFIKYVDECILNNLQTRLSLLNFVYLSGEAVNANKLTRSLAFTFSAAGCFPLRNKPAQPLKARLLPWALHQVTQSIYQVLRCNTQRKNCKDGKFFMHMIFWRQRIHLL